MPLEDGSYLLGLNGCRHPLCFSISIQMAR
jgi:hypothetical protein